VEFFGVFVVAIDRNIGFAGGPEKGFFYRGDLGRLDSVYPQPVGSCGLWVAKTTQFKRIARRNEQDVNEIRIVCDR